MGTLFKRAEKNLYFSVDFLSRECFFFFIFIVVKNRFQLFSYAIPISLVHNVVFSDDSKV